ncbi:MAG: RNA polymerase sigma factor [Planctomycetes bacterium]|jgi:RNA polymerase sigma-70 factor (ECF subfamily)|nr:RNA polymerase sigma factor [Planctomycetota bacterium]
MEPSPAAAGLDEARLAGLVRAHQAALWRYLRYLGCQPAEADDLVQETFLRVWRHPFTDQGPAAAAGYLRTVARNLFLDATRRAKVRPAFVDLSAAEAAWAVYEREDGGEGYRGALRTCLGLLAERARRALALFYGEDRSREAVAANLGLSADGVKTLLRRSRETLRECIERKLGR